VKKKMGWVHFLAPHRQIAFGPKLSDAVRRELRTQVSPGLKGGLQ
jgi:hypothetical protein